MRVLMISKACVVGAYQTKLEALGRLPGVDLTAVVPPFWRDPAGTLVLDRQHVQGYRLVVEPCAFNGNYHLHFYPRLGRVIRQVRPEIVHIDEEPYNLATAHALWLARRAGARSLFFSWQNIQRQYPLPFRLLEGYVLHHADYGIVGNQESAGVWRAKGYRGPLAVIPQFGVDPELYSPQTRPREEGREGELVIGFVGRLVEEKGADLLLEALAGLEGPWRAVVVGGGPALAALRAQALQLGLAPRVDLKGPVPSAQMPAIYHGIDVLVLPSRTRRNWKEQFGRALVEAMACETAVIGSDSGEIPHVIGNAGLIFPEGDVSALQDCLRRLMTDPALRRDLSRRGRERVLEHYTQAKIATRTLAVYEASLGSGS